MKKVTKRKAEMRQADIFAKTLDDEGTKWQTKDGRMFEEVAESMGAQREANEKGELRYVFPDGSAVVTAASGDYWDIEGETPFSWESV